MPQPQGWERQHDPQRRHGKTFVAVLAIDAALRRHPDKKVAFGVRQMVLQLRDRRQGITAEHHLLARGS